MNVKHRQSVKAGTPISEPAKTMDQLKQLLQYLEKNKIINVPDVVRDQEQMKLFIQDLVNLDMNDFIKSGLLQ